MDNQTLDLLEKVLTFSLWPEPLRPVSIVGRNDMVAKAAKALDKLTSRFGIRLAVQVPVTDKDRQNGTFWPILAHTMAGRKRLRNIRELCSAIERQNVPGSFVECGVWRGGSSIYARACLPETRAVYVCDSFQGLPDDPNEPISVNVDILRVPLAEVQKNFDSFGLNKNVIFVKGWFSETLSTVPAPIAILRADGDMYISTMSILENLYHKVSIGGYVIIDDYSRCPECKRAVDFFRDKNKVRDEIKPIDDDAIFWEVRSAVEVTAR